MKEGGTIRRIRVVLIGTILGFVCLFSSCAFMELGSITDISGPIGPDPGDATPTSWYIRNVFQGTWNYQYWDSGALVQNYRVTHEVSKEGAIKFAFMFPDTGVKHFLATGTINMNTGLFFGECGWGQIGSEEGALSFTGAFATQTSQIEAYSVILERRFQPGQYMNYTVLSSRAQ